MASYLYPPLDSGNMKSNAVQTAIVDRPEQAVLLQCMLHPSVHETEPLPFPSGEMDWSYLVAIAGHHGLLPLLFRLLKSQDTVQVPEQISQFLQDQYQTNLLRNRILSQELVTIMDQFESLGIKALAYKGPSLTVSVYGDLGLRHFGDLDVLIDESHVIKASEMLASLGYSRVIPHLSPVKERDFIRTDHEHEFISADQMVHIDLHWRLSTRRFPAVIKVDELFDQAEDLSFSGGTISIISSQDLLLLLCMHASKDLWRKFVWVCDIDRLVRARQDINWDALIARARSSHCERMLYLGLLIAHKLVKTPIPASILSEAESRGLTETGIRILRSAWHGEPETGFLKCLGLNGFILTVCDSFNDRVRYILRTLFYPTESEMMRYRLPDRLHFVYYFIVPTRKIFFCTARAFKRWVFN